MSGSSIVAREGSKGLAPIRPHEGDPDPKGSDCIDFGIPSLTARAWYEAKFGHKAWQRIDRIPQEIWRSYLDWYRDVLDLVVENEVELTSIEPDGNLLLAHLRHSTELKRVQARKIVLATGFDGSGCWRAPPSLVANLPAERYARTADDIDFPQACRKARGRARGRRVRVRQRRRCARSRREPGRSLFSQG